MITIPIYYLIIAGIVLLWLVFKLFEYKSKIAMPEQIYVDSSGIANNPPKVIDVLQNKTINFELGKHFVKVSQVTVGTGLTIINKIALLYEALQQEITKKPGNKVKEIQRNFIKVGIFKQIVYQIYLLSKPFVKSKRKFRKDLFKEADKNPEKIFLITEQVFDYWSYMGKLLAVLSRGGSRRMIIGADYTWNSLEMDSHGKTIIKPRFALSMN